MIVRKIDRIFNQAVKKYIINDVMIVWLLEPSPSNSPESIRGIDSNVQKRTKIKDTGENWR